MRLVPIEYVKENSYLAKTLFNDKGQILLSRGIILNSRLIEKIKDAGFFSVYISDDPKDEMIEDVIKPEIRQKAILSVKKIYQSVAVRKNKFSETGLKNAVLDLKNIIDEIVEQLFNDKDIMIQLVDIKNVDDYTYAHSVNVAILSMIIGISYGLNKMELYDLTMGALMHDIGKMFIPEELLKKPGPLTTDEFKIVQEHTVRGFNYLKDHLDLNAKTRIIALQHHEKVDGTGYPYGLRAKEINMFAKIVAIADVYDGLTSDRVYRRALPINEALEYIMGGCGRYFDFEIVKAFIKKVIPYPVGTIVKLSNGAEGIIESVHIEFPLRPKVKIVKEYGQRVENYTVDLIKENALVIEDISYEL